MNETEKAEIIDKFLEVIDEKISTLKTLEETLLNFDDVPEDEKEYYLTDLYKEITVQHQVF